MKQLAMRKCSRTLSGVFVACLAFAAQGSTNAFNDAVFWFRGGKDLNADGYMQTGEFFDDLHANDATHDNHKMAMSSEYYTGDLAGYKINARLDEEQVSFPALGTNIINTMKVLRISNVKGNNKYFPFDVNPHPVFERNNISNEYTIVSRIRVDHGGSYNKCFVKVGYNASERQGMWLGFAPSYTDYPGCMRVAAYRTPNSSGSDAAVLFNLPVPTNTWVDLAVVVGNDKMRVGVATPASLTSHNNNPTIAFDEKPMWTDNCELLGSEHYKFFCKDGQETSAEASNADTSCFLGSVQQLAIWRRALTDQEVMDAFGMPRPAIFRTGFDNDVSNEFGGERIGSSQTIDGLGSWQNIANTMKAGDTWTVNFTALRDEANLPQIFTIKSLGASAQIEPVLNETSLGENYVGSNGRTFWPVPANLIKAGANTLVISRKDGGVRDFVVDAMELGGSLGMGKLTYSSTDDGRADPERIKTGVPSASDPNPQHWPTKLDPSTGNNLHFRVWVDPDVADKASFTFKTAVSCDIASGEAFSVYINGKKRTSVNAQTAWKSYTFDPGVLNGGWNDFNFVTTTSCCSEFGCFHLETSLSRAFGYPPFPGLSVFIR